MNWFNPYRLDLDRQKKEAYKYLNACWKSIFRGVPNFSKPYVNGHSTITSNLNTNSKDETDNSIVITLENSDDDENLDFEKDNFELDETTEINDGFAAWDEFNSMDNNLFNFSDDLSTMKSLSSVEESNNLNLTSHPRPNTTNSINIYNIDVAKTKVKSSKISKQIKKKQLNMFLNFNCLPEILRQFDTVPLIFSKYLTNDVANFYELNKIVSSDNAYRTDLLYNLEKLYVWQKTNLDEFWINQENILTKEFMNYSNLIAKLVHESQEAKLKITPGLTFVQFYNYDEVQKLRIFLKNTFPNTCKEYYIIATNLFHIDTNTTFTTLIQCLNENRNAIKKFSSSEFAFQLLFAILFMDENLFDALLEFDNQPSIKNNTNSTDDLLEDDDRKVDLFHIDQDVLKEIRKLLLSLFKYIQYHFSNKYENSIKEFKVLWHKYKKIQEFYLHQVKLKNKYLKLWFKREKKKIQKQFNKAQSAVYKNKQIYMQYLQKSQNKQRIQILCEDLTNKIFINQFIDVDLQTGSINHLKQNIIDQILPKYIINIEQCAIFIPGSIRLQDKLSVTNYDFRKITKLKLVLFNYKAQLKPDIPKSPDSEEVLDSSLNNKFNVSSEQFTDNLAGLIL